MVVAGLLEQKRSVLVIVRCALFMFVGKLLGVSRLACESDFVCMNSCCRVCGVGAFLEYALAGMLFLVAKRDVAL